MTTQIATGMLLLVLPVAYNVLFAVLARTFDYPDILRQPTKDILRRFTEGGSGLVLTWWGFAMTAVLLAPAVLLLSTRSRTPTRPSWPLPPRSECSPPPSSSSA